MHLKSAILLLLVTLLPANANANVCGGPMREASDLYRCALQKDGRIVALSSRREEREGRLGEAKQVPNPLVESELGFSEKDQSVAILQPIEIGGKRSSRRRIADAENRVSLIEDEVALSEAATDIAVALVRHRQLKTRHALLEETKESSVSLVKRFRAKSVRTPEERNALSIFSMQSTVLETELLSVKQELKEIQAELEAAIGRKLGEADRLSSFEKRDWPALDASKVGETFEARLAMVSVERAAGEVDLQQSLGWPEFAIGPMLERNGGGEAAWGAKLEFSLPLFNMNGGARQKSKAEHLRAEAIASRTKIKETSLLTGLLEQYSDITKFLRSSPSQAEIKKAVSESLQLFGRGMIQPSAIVETYRSSLETLEAVQEKELSAYRLYWKVRSFAGDLPREFL